MPGQVILVVDDDPGIILLCQRLLERAGFLVISATRSEQGLKILEQRSVDLILADIRMPGMDGFQLIERARGRQPDLAIVVMTGFGTVETAIESLRRGADGLVLKPFTEGEKLVQTVEQALAANRAKIDFAGLKALRPLFDLSAVLFTETNPDQLEDLVLDLIGEHMQCKHAALYSRSHREEPFHLVSWRGKLFFGDGESLESWELPVLVNRQDKVSERWQAVLEDNDLETTLAAPVTMKNCESIIFAARDTGEAAFRPPDKEVFVILARQIAIALENARLYLELRETIRRLEDSQQALIQAEKLAAMGKLTASIAHEINNPLQAIHNCLHLAGRKELSSSQQGYYLDLARNELDRLRSTVQRMLNFYRPGRLAREPTDINELARRVIQLLGPQIKDQKIQVHLDLAPDLPRADLVSDQIQQVIFNIIINSIEAMPDGGRLAIETRLERDNLQVIIEDTGPGILESERKHIFDPFISTKEGGTGLGLSISYSIVADHGGQLELLPSHGRGACFRILLPLGEGK